MRLTLGWLALGVSAVRGMASFAPTSGSMVRLRTGAEMPSAGLGCWKLTGDVPDLVSGSGPSRATMHGESFPHL